MIEDVSRGEPPRDSFLAKLRYRLWKLPRRKREAARRRREERERTKQGLPNRLLEASLKLVLLALLQRRDQYGYGILRELEEAGLPSGGMITIYPALTQLERTGLVEGYIVLPDDPRPGYKYYRLLPAGEAALEESWREWRSTVSAIDALRQRGEKR